MLTIEYEPNKLNTLTGKRCNLLIMSNGKKRVVMDIRGIRKQAILVLAFQAQLEALCRK